MGVVDFVRTLIKATEEGKLVWTPVLKKHFSTITNISVGIVDAFYSEYDEDTNVVIYQYKSYDEYNDSEDISFYISIVNSSFKYKYEITPKEIEEMRGQLFKFYKEVQKKAYKIDDFFSKFTKDFT